MKTLDPNKVRQSIIDRRNQYLDDYARRAKDIHDGERELTRLLAFLERKKFPFHSTWEYISPGSPLLRIEREQLPLLRKAMGEKVHFYSKWANDADSVTVCVYFKSFPMCKFFYVRPYSNKGRCKIVKTEHTRSTETYAIVCEPLNGK